MTPYIRKLSSLVGAMLIAGTLTAHADVRYTSQMTMGGATAPGEAAEGMAMPAIRTTTFLKDMHERVETSMHMGPMTMDTVTLTLCDKHQSVKMNPALKIYTVGPIGAMTFGAPGQGRPGMQMPEGKPGAGTLTTTMAVQDLGREKVAGHDAHHFKLTMRTQSDGCIGKADNTFIMEDWIAALKGGLVCPERYAPTRVVPNERGCKITYKFKGDLLSLKEIGAGMVVKMIIYGDDKGGKPVAQQDLRDYSTAPLDESLFAPPADYKQVSPEEYQKQESDAMRKAMMGGLSDMMHPPADDSTDQATPDGGASDSASNAGTTQAPPPEKKKDHKKFKIPGLPF